MFFFSIHVTDEYIGVIAGSFHITVKAILPRNQVSIFFAVYCSVYQHKIFSIVQVKFTLNNYSGQFYRPISLLCQPYKVNLFLHYRVINTIPNNP